MTESDTDEFQFGQLAQFAVAAATVHLLLKLFRREYVLDTLSLFRELVDSPSSYFQLLPRDVIGIIERYVAYNLSWYAIRRPPSWCGTCLRPALPGDDIDSVFMGV
jgi:hypothetical protein